MKIFAIVKNSFNTNKVIVSTNDDRKILEIPAKTSGYGSGINGGELLFLSLAVCYCNDIYREAEKRRIKVTSVEVEVIGEFNTEGRPASNISYSADVKADAPDDKIIELIRSTDKLAEIHNTLRTGVDVKLVNP